jgi:hypothetical protein
MSYVQFAARFENLRNAFDDTLAEIESRQYQGNSVTKLISKEDFHGTYKNTICSSFKTL